jgi:hypothetical protein
VGASVGVALREGMAGALLAIPVLVAGFLIVGALVLIWRSFCEFYVAVFRISDDLAAMRAAAEQGHGAMAPPQPSMQAQTQAHAQPQAQASRDYSRS